MPAYADDQGLSPRAAATLMASVALLAVAFFVGSLLLDSKSNDSLYDITNPAAQPSPRLRAAQPPGKKKDPAAAPDAAPPAVPEAKRPAPKLLPTTTPSAD